ncbi:MAG TPA: ATP-binding protein [Longimicrobiaceae bacterium]|jgi:predicted AAA+ superfamily ATPase|nr:ATP-binding protein [Longimicrobiaceae bacterium]
MERTVSQDLLRLKLSEALAAPVQPVTRRDVRLPKIAGKAMAVIGVRRGGKTSFLHQRMAERVAEGRARESQLLVSIEDERLVGMTAADLGWLVEEHERQVPGLRQSGSLSIYLDEVQLVPGWETLVRRLMDVGGIELFVSGSSAKLLSREVATSLRGRAMEVLVHPFSFREALRHAGKEPDAPWERLPPSRRAALDGALLRYLEEGGFPEAQKTERRDRLSLLKGYVDVMVLRDVVERHRVSNPQALRWLQRHLLATPGGSFSMKKLYDSLRSQGVAVAKDTLYEYLDHIEDAFLVRTVSMHSRSERQRMVNPRKAYPIDPGLIPLYERTGRENHGRALETAVLLELDRRAYTADWLRAGDGWEVDFFAERPGDPPVLVQVCMDTTGDATWQREVRALEAAAEAYPEAEALLITLDPSPPARELPARLRWRSAAEWLLATEP